MREDVLRTDRGGMWPWFLQRLTAVWLVFGLGMHLVVTHVFSIGALDFAGVGDRLTGWFFPFVDLTLLAAALFHGLNGLRMVLLDYGFIGRARSMLDTVLVVVGLGAFGYGVWALWPWLTA